MARLSQKQKNELMRELQETFGFDENIFATRKVEYPISPLVFKRNDDKFTVVFNKSPEYDYRVTLPRGKLFVKIFVSPRKFNSRDAIGTRYKTYLDKSRPIFQSYATDDDLWFIFVKTPDSWVWYLSALSKKQETELNTTIRRARRRIQSINEKRAVFEQPPIETSILIAFLVEWIIFYKPIYGLS